MKKCQLTIFSFFLCFALYAQKSIGIGVADPHSSAVLELSSTSRGFLPPAYNLGYNTTSKSRLPLFSSASATDAGLFYYNSYEKELVIYNDAHKEWQSLAGMPTGAIIIWAGTIADIPAGYQLCDGSNGSPDLRSRFVVGYSGTGDYNIMGKKGGVSSVTLTKNQIPSHNHGVSDPGHSHPASSSHQHSVGYSTFTGSAQTNKGAAGGLGPSTTSFVTSEANLKNAAISVGNAKAVQSIGTTGGGVAHENRPPYYVVAFIMKMN